MAGARYFLNTGPPDRLTSAAEDSLSHPIVAEELDLLERTSERLRAVSPPATPSEAPIVAELERIREQLVSGSDRKDVGALTQQWHRQSALLAQLRASREAPAIDPSTPYFAHLRLRENGTERDLCLGRATFIEQGVRIVDWRNAPISRIFYRYRQGEEFEEELAGRVRAGEVVARRTVQIRNATLQAIDAPEGHFDADPDVEGGWRQSERERPRLLGGETSAVRAYQADAATERRLGTDRVPPGRRADKHLPEITGLIDPEQFELISRPSSGFLVVRGTAGSGKTTVALHRVAYLAYDDPEVDSEQTLVVVFSEALRKYVSHVLPSLGLVNVLGRRRAGLQAEKRPQRERDGRRDGGERRLIARVERHEVARVDVGETERSDGDEREDLHHRRHQLHQSRGVNADGVHPREPPNGR